MTGKSWRFNAVVINCLELSQQASTLSGWALSAGEL